MTPADHPPIVIYTRPGCGYCSAAIARLKAKGVAFTQIDMADQPDKRAEMVARSGRQTFPQIFVGETHVGGCDDFMALDRDGRFDALLAV